MEKIVTILGSTGSIGTQALDVCKAHNFRVGGLAAYQNVKLLEAQVRAFKPRIVCIYTEQGYRDLKIKLADCDVKIVTGMDGLCEVATLEEADTTLNAVVGMIGLRPTLEAIAKGKTIALANKETLVTGGKLVLEAAKEKGVPIYPIDSEHSAIFQALQGNEDNTIRRIFLTASGGPFFGRTAEELQQVTVADALKHPNWSMGPKITIDSATLMNKGLEFIEAIWLFDLKPEQIDVVVHRQSIVHSAVEFEDFSVMAQMGVPDMHIPIQYALTYPKRYPSGSKPLSLFDVQTLTFEHADEDVFCCLKACKEAIAVGGLLPTVVNGANEQATALFLEGKISFLQIGQLVYQAMQSAENRHSFDLADIINIDQWAREEVLRQLS